jgi:phage tail-like protein
VDANGTRYHLLLGKPDWSACLDPQGQPLSASWQDEVVNHTGLDWDSEHAHLILEPLLFHYVASPADVLPKPEDRRGAARDRLGNWYWIDPNRKIIRTLPAGMRSALDYFPVPEPFFCPPESESPFAPVEPEKAPAEFTFSGLTITEGQYLVVGLLKPKGLLIFDLLAGGAPTQIAWPKGIDFVPFDMSPMPGGGLWILDRENRRFWGIDRFFNIIARDQELQPPGAPAPEIFQPESGDPRLTPSSGFPQGIKLADSTPLDVEDPISIEGLPDCTVLILDRHPSEDFSQVSRFRLGQRLGDAVSLSLLAAKMEESAEGFTLTAHDFAFLPEHEENGETIPDRLYIASSSGNQSFAFHIEGTDTLLDLDPLPEIYLPMRLFTGKALVAAGDKVYYDLGERWLPLVQQFRPRYRSEGTFFRQFDGRQPNLTWHRLLLDACLPPDTSVEIWSRAADDPADLASQPWQRERLYLRNDGSELPFAGNPFNRPFRPVMPAPQAPLGSGTWELLFQRAQGQFLELRVTLKGNGQRTPRLRAMRVYYPRFSYLEHYLPAAYRQDPESTSFLDRFLANPEGIYTTIEDRIAAVRQLFDVSTAPPEALDWLSGWFGAALDPAWDDYRRRLFIRYAMLFFQYRGTPRGIRMALRLALDACPGENIFTEMNCCGSEAPGSLRIVEAFRTRAFPGVVYGDPTDVLRTGISLENAIWRPEDGRAELTYRYQQSTGQPGEYPIYDPGSADWKLFSLKNLGFVPSAHTDDWPLWQAYLMRAYGTVTAYNTAYHLDVDSALDSFDNAEMPQSLPADGAPLEDWYRFETVFLPLVRNAHHFSVLLPMPGNLGPESEKYQSRLALTRKIVELEKPAHTTYDIRFFWALFRIGEARLGLDTQLDLGSRSPDFTPAFTLGQNFLAEGYLSDPAPPLPSDRLKPGSGCAPAPVFNRPIQRTATTSGRCGC